MPRDPRKWLWDIIDACTQITRFVTGRTFEDYQRDNMLRSAVERQFEILGEAVNQLHQARPDMAERITDWRLAVGFRNALIHRYFQVSDEAVWDTITNDLPRLATEAAAIMQEAEP